MSLVVSCQVESIDVELSSGTTPPAPPVCGDGILADTEICDDGNTVDELECDYGIPECLYCNSTCSAELPLVGRYCGDGIIDIEEACDDGNTLLEQECEYGILSCLGCSEDCTTEFLLSGGFCGDDICQPAELDTGLECPDDCVTLEGLPFCEDSLSGSFRAENIESTGLTTGGYQLPAASIKTILESSLDFLLFSNAPQAARSTIEQGAEGELDYILCRDADELTVLRWEPRIEGTGRPRFALRTQDARAAIISVPHGLSEAYILEQGVELFQNQGLRALIVSGVHRCESDTASPCSGDTDACGFLEAPRLSDMAHIDNTVFQWIHELLADRFPMDTFFSLSSEINSGIHVSNGTANNTEPSSPIAQLIEALQTDEILVGAGIHTCNQFSGSLSSDSDLCAINNIQGRMLNFSESPCTIDATTSSQRFIHLEQSENLLSGHRELIELAISAALN